MSLERPRRRGLAASAAVLLLLLVLALPTEHAHGAGGAAVPANSPTISETGQDPKAAGPRIRRLSDERRLTRWAHVQRLADVYRRTSAKSPLKGRLRFFTEDGFPEVYLLLKETTDRYGRLWVQIRVPKRPNGITGWVPREALGPYNITRHRLVVNRRTLQARLFDRGRMVWKARVGVGKRGTPTPGGRFWIREKLKFRNTPLYGTRALGTSAYAPTLSDWPNGGVVGIHGTDQPQLIPGRPSHGCVRIRNRDIARLWRLIPVGTPVWIR